LSLAISGQLARARNTPNTERSTYDCHIADLPTSWAFDDHPGVVVAHSAMFGELGQTAIDLHFRSTETSPIQSIALVLEYTDAGQETIDRVPIFAAVKPAMAKTPLNVLAPADAWRTALLPGDSATMSAVTNGIRTGHCPVRAQVTFASVQFTDGSVRIYSSPEWRLGPIPTLIPTLPEVIPDLPVEAPASLLAKLTINASGEVLDVAPAEPADPKLVDWIRSRMGPDWKFHPALLDGKPTDSELNVLFLIHAKGMTKFPETRPVLHPVTLIRFLWSHDLSPQTSATDKLMVMYGFLQEGSAPDYPFKGFASQVQKPSNTQTPAQSIFVAHQ
jgi:hypothetical protein